MASAVVPLSYAQKNASFLTGTIRNYANQPLYIYKCGVYPAIGGSDTLLFIDSTITDKKGAFAFFFNHDNQTNHKNHSSDNGGLYRLNLPHNQWFYILNDGNPVEIKTVYQFQNN